MIVGLGNPGREYEGTRHNVGADWINLLAKKYNFELKENTKFKGLVAKTVIEEVECVLLAPTTFMNLSGQSVRLVADYFKVPLERMLVAYDEMAFEPGVARLKFGGGANGHNGLKSLFNSFDNQKKFFRLRIGVGHPGKPQMVTSYLTRQKIPSREQLKLDSCLDFQPSLLQEIMSGDLEKAMTSLHVKKVVDGEGL